MSPTTPGAAGVFVPRNLCADHNTSPEELLAPDKQDEAKAVMARLIDKAQGHLDDALQYCVNLPRSAYRIRLFCLTPMYFALRTCTAPATTQNSSIPTTRSKSAARKSTPSSAIPPWWHPIISSFAIITGD